MTPDRETGALRPAAPPRAASHALVQAIGLDLGGTKLLAGAAGPDGRLGPGRAEASRTCSEAALFEQLAHVVGSLRDERPRAVVALGAPGAVDPRSGGLDFTPNVPVTPGRALGRDLGEALGLDVVAENDVNLAALAEARLGAGQGAALSCFVSFGTGVGLGIVSGGRILPGAHGRAGEISYLPLAADAVAAAARSEAGQFEDLVGTAAIRRAYGRDGADVRTIFARAARGEAAALGTIRAIAAEAARGLASLQAILDPDVIVIGGGIGTHRLFRETLAAEAARLLPFPLRLAAPRLGAAAGMTGAVILAADLAGLPTPLPAGQAAETDGETL
ncbi:ROK family protein [Poseidonocella sp. HB161398]|uniref:ROK family protein n=1 Tax=Poseidonocella sp. HB161398 TaxID=2320855 RepID=UPI0014874D67|nr:ROK family protein [Poseidonocella sp. HB161398]